MCCGRQVLGPAAAAPQRWKFAAAVSRTATTAPRVMAAWTASRARGNLWASMAHLLNGSPATCVRPVALRPRLATGLPLSIGRHRGTALTDVNTLRPRSSAAREA
jgi:hypothetical protein